MLHKVMFSLKHLKPFEFEDKNYIDIVLVIDYISETVRFSDANHLYKSLPPPNHHTRCLPETKYPDELKV